MNYIEIRQLVEQRMDTLITSYLDSCSYPTEGLLQNVEQIIKQQARQSSKGGKRLRAILMVSCYLSASSQKSIQGHSKTLVPTPVLDLACALEIFQTSALVHDDIIDQAPQRRGRPSAHKAIANDFMQATLVTNEESIKAGQSLGLLLGNLLASCAIQVASNAASTLPASDAIRQTFLTMVGRVNQGQILDVSMETMPLDDPQALQNASENVIALKTSSYTSLAPIELGLLASGCNEQLAEQIADSIGSPLGLAYQLRDDLLDVTGYQKKIGKMVGGDIREGKRTVLLASALSKASQEQREQLINVYTAQERTDQDVALVTDIFVHCGAIDSISQRIKRLQSNSDEAIKLAGKQLQLTCNNQEILQQACFTMFA